MIPNSINRPARRKQPTGACLVKCFCNIYIRSREKKYYPTNVNIGTCGLFDLTSQAPDDIHCGISGAARHKLRGHPRQPLHSLAR